ncbi:hypothetical protein [Aquimarina algiphila]|uniref:Uncharacterized protein n=1 Tax=Aquimarina algiphila TaxID=2047982 RepID=A0A554VD81_9FLAO|nr:hypothetical protein [Aquimarina algiphila]TSE04797.1 hypothetical protein FOF46_25165 [Aquimarina algiphila]
MKSIYKILILGMVCLLSTKTFAQFEVTSDPSNKQVQGKSGSIAACSCAEGIEGDWTRFQSILAQQAARERDKWLADQQVIQKNEIERRLRKSFPSFPEAQKEYFKETSYREISKNILDGVQREFANASIDNKGKVEQKRIEINTLQYRSQVSDALAAYTFGDLKSGGKPIKDYFSVTGRINEIASELNNSLKPAANDASKIKNGLLKVEQRDLLLDRMVELAIARFNSYNVEDKVKVMTKYLISANANIGDYGLLYTSPPFIYNPEEHNPRQIAIDQARTLGTSDALPDPTETGDQAVRLHAIASISNTAYNYTIGKTDLQQELGRYFNHNRYNAQSVTMMQRVMNPYLSNNNLSAFSSELTSNMVSPTLQSSSNRELALSWRADGLLEGVNHPFDGVGNVMAELYTNEERTFPREGNSIRQMFNANGLNVPSTISDYDLGRVFDFNKTPYGGKPGPNFYYNVEIIFKPTIGGLLWNQNVNTSNIFDHPVHIEGALALARGETFDFEFRKIVYDLTNSLQLDNVQKDWLLNNRERAFKINDYLSANGGSTIALQTMTTLIRLEAENSNLIHSDPNKKILRTVTLYNDGVFDTELSFCGCSQTNFDVRQEYFNGTITEDQLFNTYGAQIEFQIQNPDGSFRTVSQLDFYLETAELREGVVREILAWIPWIGDASEVTYELVDGNFGLAAFNAFLALVPFDKIISTVGGGIKYAFRQADRVVSFTAKEIWGFKPFFRGNLIESALAKTRYKDYLNTIDIPTANGKPNRFWPYFDFIKGNKVISVKTTNALSGFGSIRKNIEDLRLYVKGNAANGGTIINDVDLDVYVPEGYDQSLLDEMKILAESYGINFNIFEFK